MIQSCTFQIAQARWALLVSIVIKQSMRENIMKTFYIISISMSEPSILMMYEIYGGVSDIVYQLITTPFMKKAIFKMALYTLQQIIEQTIQSEVNHPYRPTHLLFFNNSFLLLLMLIHLKSLTLIYFDLRKIICIE